MKKLIFGLIAVFIAAQAIAVFAADSEDMDSTEANASMETKVMVNNDELEKILSPEMIKQYTDIIKRGASLYGKKIASSTMAISQEQTREQNREDNGQASTTLEKILSPDQIKFFDKIKKIGESLWGERKDNATSTKTEMDDDNASATLEKIPSPDQIGLFERIRQIGTALWGIRKTMTANVRTSLIASSDAACVNTAIDKKDDALIASIAASKDSLTAAINARRDCQKSAINATDTSTQVDNVKACAKTFEETNKTITKNSKQERENIWNTYKEELKACNGSEDIVIEDGGAELSL